MAVAAQRVCAWLSGSVEEERACASWDGRVVILGGSSNQLALQRGLGRACVPLGFNAQIFEQ